mgnify:FL=1
MPSKNYDYCVVGQGISGTLLTYFLRKEGKKVLVIDKYFEKSSSRVAAGIVNPVTGKNFVKTWRADDFIPFALTTYTEMANENGVDSFTKANILRTLDSALDENNWISRTADSTLSDYLVDNADDCEFSGKVSRPFAYGELTGTFHVHIKNILQHFRQQWQETGDLVDEQFIHEDLKHHETGFEYLGYKFKEIIFCEGYQAVNNPFFPDAGLAPSKGEVLLVKIPNAGFKKMYKDKIFIVHQYDDIYWVGSGYEWDTLDESPTQKAYDHLSSQLSRILTIPYEIVDHLAAIRPTMHDRRPVFLEHVVKDGIYLFNGLGTKGSSIGPFAAKKFCRYLLFKNEEDKFL